MKIIDSNKDFYDYCQGLYPDNSTTFDRRDSYELTKLAFASNFVFEKDEGTKHLYTLSNSNKHFILLQVCNKFWLFLLTGIKDVDEAVYCTDYTLELLTKWDNYNVKREKLKLSCINPKGVFPLFSVTNDKSYRITPKIIEKIKQAIDTNNYVTTKAFNKFRFVRGSYWDKTKEERHIPILKNLGFAGLVDPVEIYFALDKYFAKEKTESERTESIDMTDKEKVINHGFDAKTSFSGKNKNGTK